LGREKNMYRFFSSSSHIPLNVMPAYNYFFLSQPPTVYFGTTQIFNKFGSKLGRNWEEKI
jgi:hypothetical protein